MWKYEVSNTDHTLMQGVELVNNWLLGEAETTIGMKYESTIDGRNAAKHERSIVAGSGDPRRTPKSSPEAAPTKAHPGSTGGLARDTGDKEEVHTSEEELGVTTPRPASRPSGASRSIKEGGVK
jgi:hypothetical protein